MSDTHCGYVAVVGRPNVGKSTLVNALTGTKVSIVTAKPQTTRHRILGVYTSGGDQVVFVDTPGLHRNADKAMNRLMNRTAVSALLDADLVLFVIEAGRWTDEDGDVLKRLAKIETPVVAVLNKVDLVNPKERLLGEIAKMTSRHEFADIVPVSARKPDNLEALRDVVRGYLPDSPFLFPADMRTDRSAQFLAAEVIREKLTESLHKEVPYGLTVQIERYDADSDHVAIDAIIWVERDSQKGIVVGKDGNVLKRVGKSARLELRQQLERPVHVELWVKVKDNWADNDKELSGLGYESP